MIIEKTLIVFPEKYISGNTIFENKTDEIMLFKMNAIIKGVDPSVENIVKNPNKTVYIESDLKVLVSADCNLVSTPAQKKAANYFIISRKDNQTIKTITVSNLIKYKNNIPKVIIQKLEEALMFDLISYKDHIYMPSQFWGREIDWIKSNSLHKEFNTLTGYPSSQSDVVIDLESAMYYFNNPILTEESFTKLKLMLENQSDMSLAVGMMNSMNPTKSFVELLVLYNYIPVAYRNKNKKKILKTLHAIYKIPFFENDLTLSNIEVFSNMNGFDLSLEKQEFIADNYVNSNMEQSSMFKLKIKIK